MINSIAFVTDLITSNISEFSWTSDLKASHCFDRTDSCSSGVGGACGTSWKKSTSSRPRNSTVWEEARSLRPAVGPHVPSYSLSPWPLHTKKQNQKPFFPLATTSSPPTLLNLVTADGMARMSHKPLACRSPDERIQAVDQIAVSCKRASTSAASHSLFLNGRMVSRAWWPVTQEENTDFKRQNQNPWGCADSPKIENWTSTWEKGIQQPFTNQFWVCFS